MRLLHVKCEAGGCISLALRARRRLSPAQRLQHGVCRLLLLLLLLLRLPLRHSPVRDLLPWELTSVSILLGDSVRKTCVFRRFLQ